MCDVRLHFFQKKQTHGNFIKGNRKSRVGYKNVKNHRSKYVKWELPTGFLLSLVIYSTYHQN